MTISQTLPSLNDITLLPDAHPLLLSRLDLLDFGTDDRDPHEIAALLIAAMDRYDGVGLAANQIGLDCRAFAMRMNNRPMVLFNPVITELAAETISMDEGCLTFPNLWLKIARPESCRVIYHDADGNRLTNYFEGLNARIALHETDHVNGVVMTSKVSKLKLDMAKKRAKKHSR